MEYLNDAELEDMGAKELLQYYKKLKERKIELLDEVYRWGSTIKSARLELKEKLIYIETEIAFAELERLDFDDDVIAFYNTLTTVN